ncbi:hypothetical protein [Liquorilactobacillus uvarum]|uniref:Uncharacterized protein n=1 Tax=Liquorilactobacillus uvarum DSM 19971 TaxID=1423812 RepID=A0A0R1Q114_9LACO|nr:hypothetical protein [Liquorilactobacillus uvarum]KRL38400.1 hypothetical protein FD20_GL001600 [Liquorilactobacillus uvarum DSM 19971]
MGGEEHSNRTDIVQQIKMLQKDIQIQQTELVQKYDEVNELYQLLEKRGSVSSVQKHFSEKVENEDGFEIKLQNNDKKIPAGPSKRALRELQKYKTPERIKWWKIFWK